MARIGRVVEKTITILDLMNDSVKRFFRPASYGTTGASAMQPMEVGTGSKRPIVLVNTD